MPVVLLFFGQIMLKLCSFLHITLTLKKEKLGSSKPMTNNSKNTCSLIRSLYFSFVDCRERSLAIVVDSGPSFV